MNLVKAGKNDLHQIAHLHCLGLPNDFLAQLGESFLDHLYATLLDETIGFVIVAKEANNILGFVSSAYDTGKFFKKSVRQHFFAFSWHALRFLLSHPGSFQKVFGAFLYPNKQPRQEIIPELISIIVDPQHQGKKIGKKLIAEFEKTLKSRHHSAYFLIVGANNAPARQFYLSCGFREVGQVVSMGRQFVRLSKEVV